MGCEYLFELKEIDENSMRELMRKMRESTYYVGEGYSLCLMFRDKSIKHDWPYDVRIFFESRNLFLLETVNWNRDLFNEFNRLLSKYNYKITEEGDDEPITLKEIK